MSSVFKRLTEDQQSKLKGREGKNNKGRDKKLENKNERKKISKTERLIS